MLKKNCFKIERITHMYKSLFLLPLLLLAFAGCNQGFVDEAQILKYNSTEAMGQAHPKIVVDGAKLEYDADTKWYYYQGTKIPALWMEFGGGPSTPPERVLAATGRYLPNGDYEHYKDGKWQKAKSPKKQELPTLSIEDEAKDYLDGKSKFRK